MSEPLKAIARGGDWPSPVLVFGSVQITTQAMSELLEADIPVSLLSRHGVLRGSLDPPRGKNILLRVAQFDLHRDPERSLALARRTVDAKLANSAGVLESFGDRASRLW
jgi:CRISPR-associated protein Cas1